MAFLRAINVRGHTVKMEQLRGLFEELGHSEVTTYIASGNVLFASHESDTGRLEDAIEARLAGALGYGVATFVRADEQVRRIAATEPFPSLVPRDGDTLHIAFLGPPAGADAIRATAALANDDDLLHLDERELYWLRRGRFADATITAAMLERALGGPITLRNANTVRKIAAKLPR